MTIEYERDGKIEIDVVALAKVVVTAAIGHIQNRNADGLDVNDQAFTIPIGADPENYKLGGPYSDSYKIWLAQHGKSKTIVDHRLSGLMMSQIRELRRQETADGIVITIGVGPGGNRNIIGAIHQAKRHWFGISPRGMKDLVAVLAEAKSSFKVVSDHEKKTL